MRLIRLTFDLPLERRDIAGFRAAVAQAAGLEEDIFHNHRSDGSVQYRYPLVQYRSERGKAAVVGIDDGVEALFNWYAKAQSLLFNEVEHPLRIAGMEMQQHALRYHPELQTYRLYQWLALNQEHYREWAALPDLASRAAALERALVAHILTFCRAVDWRLPQRLEVSIVSIGATYRTRLLGNDLVAFDLTFRSNLWIPAHIGLGKGVSHGFGVCRPERKRRVSSKTPEP